jgi:hypothetical protein
MPTIRPWSVESVHRYPVKSMRGELPERITLENGHVTGDREWAIVDPATGFLLSAKRHGALLEASARTEDDGTVVITLPSGAEVEAPAPSAAAALSEWLGREVQIQRPGDHQLPFELLVDALDEGSEVIPFTGPQHHFADFADVHLLTEASLRAATALHPDGDWDARRFRPTVLVSGENDGFAEDAWVGSTVEVGEVAIQVFMPAVRCSLPPRAQPGLARDNAISRTLKDHHNFSLGVYGALTRGGTIRPGDPVSVSAS